MSRPGAAGFTLLEVLVALAILALGMAAVLQAVAGGLGASARAERTMRATLAAQSLLAAAGGGVVPGTGDSVMGDLACRRVATAYDQDLALVRVTCGTVSLTTLMPLAPGG